jgi:LPS-assembly lipoprotein
VSPSLGGLSIQHFLGFHLMRLFALVLCLSLSACGFHLRGSYHIPLQLQELALNIPNNSLLTQPLRQRLLQSKVEVSKAEYTLEVIQDKLNKQITSTDTRAKAAEYGLYYQVAYVIKDSQNKIVFPERKLLLRRSYQYDSTAIVGKTSEEQTLIQELYEDAATQIVNQLRSFKPSTTPSTNTP